MCKSPASPEIPMHGHAHGAVEKRERSEQGLCGKIGQKSVNRKLLHIAQGLCREFGQKRAGKVLPISSGHRQNGKRRLFVPFKSACKALSVTFGDSSPKGRAEGASRPAMTREEGACKLVTASLRMQQAAKFVIARLRRSRGNLAVPSGTRESPRQIRCCLPEIAASGLRPPRNDKSGRVLF